MSLTKEQMNEISLYWHTDERKYCRKLQRIYNSVAPKGEKDNDCLCNRTRRKIWMAWFRKWALDNGYFIDEKKRVG